GQHRLAVAASEVDDAGVAVGGVVVGIQGGDGDAEGAAGRAGGGGGEGVRVGRGGGGVDRGIPGNRAGDRVGGGDGFAAGGFESDRVGEGVHPGIPAGEGVIARQHGLAVAASEIHGAGVGGGGVVVRVEGRDGDAKGAAG